MGMSPAPVRQKDEHPLLALQNLYQQHLVSQYVGDVEGNHKAMDVVRTLSMVAMWTFARMEMKMVKYKGRVANSYLQGYYHCFTVCV